MAISATCPGCGKRISGPDSAAGHKAKCPKCGQVVTFPKADSTADLAEAVRANKAARSPTVDLAEALARGAGEAPAAPPEEPETEPEPAAVSTPTPGRSEASSRRSSTTLSRMLARSSPYKPLRLLGVIMFIVGVVVSALVFLGGLVGLIVGSISGVLHWAGAVGIFIAALVVAAVVLVVAKAGSELIRLLADVGDRTRQMALLFEDHFAQDRTEDL